MLPGGSKLRFLPFITRGAAEIAYGSPFCGGAQLALAVMGRVSGQRITIFTAKRKIPHPRQRAAADLGARFEWVPFGYMSHVQAQVRAYAGRYGALCLPLGFDVPAAREPFLEAIRRVRRRVKGVDEVWCATGSGMLAGVLAEGFPDAEIKAVGVGLKSRHLNQGLAWPNNLTISESPLPFEKEEGWLAPFPCCPNYDRKAWAACEAAAEFKPRVRRLFWNVLGPSV